MKWNRICTTTTTPPFFNKGGQNTGADYLLRREDRRVPVEGLEPFLVGASSDLYIIINFSGLGRTDERHFALGIGFLVIKCFYWQDYLLSTQNLKLIGTSSSMLEHYLGFDWQCWKCQILLLSKIVLCSLIICWFRLGP